MAKAIIVIGLGFGDEGKGTMVDYYTRKYNAPINVRFNSGAQAAHNVVLPGGRHHTFNQFGSGALAPGYQYTFMANTCVFDIAIFGRERQELGVKTYIVEPGTPIVTSFHKLANRRKETMAGDKNHGSCGMGIWETELDRRQDPDDTVFFEDIENTSLLRKKLTSIKEKKEKLYGPMAVNIEGEIDIIQENRRDCYLYHRKDIINGQNNTIFEGAQGVLLDENHGFFPYVTGSTTTFKNAEDILSTTKHNYEILKVGVLRGYSTRHGKGPFPTENPDAPKQEKHNGCGQFQGAFRTGWLDLVLAKYALSVAPVDQLDLTCLDQLPQKVPVCTKYGVDISKDDRDITDILMGDMKPQYVTVDRDDLPKMISQELGVKIGTISKGPTWQDKYEFDNK